MNEYERNRKKNRKNLEYGERRGKKSKMKVGQLVKIPRKINKMASLKRK